MNLQKNNNAVEMTFKEKLRNFFPSPSVCVYYLLASVTFCYIYFHRTFFKLTFWENDMGGIYHILSYDAIKPNQYRLFVPYIFKAFRFVFPFIHDRPAYFAIILVFTFLTLIIFYNILNVYFKNTNINSWLALIVFYPMAWQYIILNQMFEFTDFAYLLFVFAGYFAIIKKYDKTLLLIFLLGTFNHDSIGFLIVMYVLFNIKELLSKKVIINTVLMTIIFIGVKKIMEMIFINNPGLSFRFNYVYNTEAFFTMPPHIVVRNVIFTFGGIHFFVLYFFIAGKWKKFNTKYLYITLALFIHVLIVFLIHTTFEGRNYIAAIPYMLILFFLFLSTQKNSFIEPNPNILAHVSK